MPDQDKLYEKQLKISYWYAQNRLLLKNILITFLVFINLVIFIFLVYLLLNNLVFNDLSYQQSIARLTSVDQDYLALREANQAQDLKVGSINYLTNNGDSDLFTEVANPNRQWWATFDYQYQISENLSPKQKTFILPGQSKNLFALGIENGNQANNLLLTNIVWHKEINYPIIFQDKYNFLLDNIEFIPATQFDLSDQLPVSLLKFDISNQSAYNYRNIDLKILLTSNNQVRAINQLSTGPLLSAEKKSFEVKFFQKLPIISAVEIVPEVNILDQSVFLKI